ncbi:MAG TPA: 2Fe-2S iron-sulfur cluster-binding protein [Methanocorpusculum sp.]|nr:2Fe-2S iron-sulfur cluster-binding protein [Methanocorpusculum sp.]
MQIVINGKPCDCEPGETILTIARRNDIFIPTMCWHDKYPGEGACRLCVVEIIDGGRRKVVASCMYPVTHEIEVETDTEKIRGYRRLIIAFMQRRAPQSGVIEKMMEEYNVPDYSLRSIKRGKCILCGLCVRACKKINIGAISMVKRGTGKKVSTPYDEPSTVCIGCGACARACPTGAIEITETETAKIIWGKEFPKKRAKKV